MPARAASTATMRPPASGTGAYSSGPGAVGTGKGAAQGGQSSLDLLMSAILASSANVNANASSQAGKASRTGHQPAYNRSQQLGAGSPGGMYSASNGQSHHDSMSNQMANSLDQIFGNSAFSRAMSTASAIPADQLSSPFFVNLLANLVQQQQHVQAVPSPSGGGNGNADQLHSLLAQLQGATPVQQTRSGRISRPPVQVPLQGALRALHALSQPGMEAVRSALETTGLLETFVQTAGGAGVQGGSESNQGSSDGPHDSARVDPAIEQALRSLLAATEPSGNLNSNRHPSKTTEGRSRDPSGQRNPPWNGGHDDQNSTSPETERDCERSGVAGAAGAAGETVPRKRRKKGSEPPIVPEHTPWPAPLRGKGSRIGVPREELLNRRRERNRISASAHRLKKQGELEEAMELVERKEAEVGALQERCARLERELEAMRRVVIGAGLELPAAPPADPGPSSQPFKWHAEDAAAWGPQRSEADSRTAGPASAAEASINPTSASSHDGANGMALGPGSVPPAQVHTGTHAQSLWTPPVSHGSDVPASAVGFGSSTSTATYAPGADLASNDPLLSTINLTGPHTLPTFPFDLSAAMAQLQQPGIGMPTAQGTSQAQAMPNPLALTLHPSLNLGFTTTGGTAGAYTPAATVNTVGTVDTTSGIVDPLFDFDFNMFMNMDSMEDDDKDGDFEPETSPRAASDSEDDEDEDEGEEEGMGDGEGDGEGGGSEARKGDKRRRKKRKSTSRSRSRGTRHQHDGDAGAALTTPVPGETPVEGESDGEVDVEGDGEGDGDGDGEADDDFLDPDMEDEDLFLPIEDVPIPPEAMEWGSGSRTDLAARTDNAAAGAAAGMHDLTSDMMKALKVDTRDQLAAVMQKLVDSAGEGGVGPEVVEKLKSVIWIARGAEGA